MKLFKSIVTATALFIAPLLHAATTPYLDYATTGTGTLTNYAIIGANAYGVNGVSPAPRINFLNVTANLSGSSVQFYKSTTNQTPTEAVINVRTNHVTSTNGFSVNAVCILRHTALDTYERIVCASPLTTNIVFASNPVTAPVLGDVIYLCNTSGAIPMPATNVSASTTLNIVGPCWTGQAQTPLLLEIINTVGTNGSINAANATFR